MNKKVLIAHQNTIPHYRVQFYNKVKSLKPDWWDFTVVYDSRETKRNFHIEVDQNSFNFNIIKVRNYGIKIGNNRYSFQNFFCDAFKSDLIIVEHAINNISYPLSFLFKFFNKKYALWGTGHDFAYPDPKGIKYFIEKIKIFLARNCDGFFAYTASVGEYLVNNGCKHDNIFILNNTIDIDKERRKYEALKNKRHKIRNDKNINNEFVIIYVGRFNKYKNSDFLFSACIELNKLANNCSFYFVGGGGYNFISRLTSIVGEDKIHYLGVVPDDELAGLFTMSDVYIFPGSVGLGPLQGLCYDLTPVVIDSPFQNSEFDYINDKNSLILKYDTTPYDYAKAIIGLLKDKRKLTSLRNQAWPSIKHLTLDNMATSFVKGVNELLKVKYLYSKYKI